MSTSSFRPPDNEATARRVHFEAQIAAEGAARRERAGYAKAITAGVLLGLLWVAASIAWEVLFA